MNLDEAMQAALDAQQAVRETAEAAQAASAARDSLIATFAPYVGRGEMTWKEVGELLCVSKQRVSQLVQRYTAQGWGVVAHTPTSPAEQLATAREAFYLARVAQEQRQERSSLGYATEAKAFLRDADSAQTDDSEDRVKWAGFHRTLDQERYSA